MGLVLHKEKKREGRREERMGEKVEKKGDGEKGRGKRWGRVEGGTKVVRVSLQ